MKLFNRIFTSAITFKISAIISAICFVINAVILIDYSFAYNIYAIFTTLILAAFELLIVLLTNKHLENAVKGLIGMIFGMIFSYDLRIFALHVNDFSATELTLGIIKLAVDILLFAVYIVSRGSKKGNTKLVSISQVTFIILAAVVIVNNIPYFVSDFADSDHRWIVQDFAETLAFILAYFSIVCSSSIVNKYKLLRADYQEKGEWTEELRAKTKKDLFS